MIRVLEYKYIIIQLIEELGIDGNCNTENVHL